MPYTIKTVDVGEYKTTYIYAERTTAGTRGKKAKPTSDAQNKLNERMSEARFRDIIHLNFTPNDFAIRIDYHHYINKFGENPDVESAQGKLRYFFRKLKKIYAENGISFDYIYVTEVGKRCGKIHHHIVLRGTSDDKVIAYLRREINKLWAYGYVHIEPLKFNENGLNGLVHYFLKDPKTAHRWACSLGLKRPNEEDGSISRRKNAISAKAAKHIDANPCDFEFIKDHATGKGWVPVQVRVTACASVEDAYPYAIPGVTIPSENVYDGMVMPGYGGVFIEIWSYREGTDYFVPVELDERIKGPKKKKEVNEKTEDEADKGGTCL